MTKLTTPRRSICAAVAAIAFSAPAIAQTSQAPMTSGEIEALPADLQTAPVRAQQTGTTISPDGVETVVRTRRIDRPVQTYAEQANGQYYPPSVIEREQWIAECERRTRGYSRNDKGGIIGGLLGAVAGGIIGNRVAGRGDRLTGTLIGAGAGGVGGYLVGDGISGSDSSVAYDCTAALDNYMAHHGRYPGRMASRAIPAHQYPPHMGYAYMPAHGYAYAAPQQIVYVPVRYEQQQRVIVRETVREETYSVPGAARVIEERAPTRAPSPKMIKQ